MFELFLFIQGPKFKISKKEFSGLVFIVPLPTFMINLKNVPIQFTAVATFQLKWTLTAVKHFIPFHTNFYYKGRLLINKDLFLHGSELKRLFP